MGAATLGHVLRAEIPAGLLGEVLHTLLAFSPSTAEVSLVVQLLQAMSEAKRSVTGGGESRGRSMAGGGRVERKVSDRWGSREEGQ